MGLTPAVGRGLDQKDTGARRRPHRDFRTPQLGALRKRADSTLDSSRFTRRYSGNPSLVSFPPLNNMLKFSGCSRLNSGRSRRPLHLPSHRGARPRPPQPPTRSPTARSIDEEQIPQPGDGRRLGATTDGRVETSGPLDLRGDGATERAADTVFERTRRALFSSRPRRSHRFTRKATLRQTRSRD